MQKRHDSVLDTQGRPVSGATVRVNTYPAGALATIYSDDGVATKSNPMVTDSAGYFEYYAANGHYSWVVTTPTSSKTINDVLHDDSLTTNQQFVVATGTGDAMVVSAFAVGYTLADGDEVRVRAPGANTVAAPTIDLPGVGVLTIYKMGGKALSIGEIFGAGHEITIRYRASPARVEMVSYSAVVSKSSTVSGAGDTVFTVSAYRIGANALDVFVNGLRQRITADYSETSTTSITFTYGLQADDEVDVYSRG